MQRSRTGTRGLECLICSAVTAILLLAAPLAQAQPETSRQMPFTLSADPSYAPGRSSTAMCRSSTTRLPAL